MRKGMHRERPRIAIFGWRFGNPVGSTARVFEAAAERYDLEIVSAEIAPELKELARFRRIPVPPVGARTRWPIQFTLSTLRRARMRADLFHALGPLPAAAGFFDLASLDYSLTGLYAAAAGPTPGQPKLLWRPRQAIGSAVERNRYRPEHTGMLAAMSPSHATELERHFPRMPVAVTRRDIDTERFHPDRADGLALRGELGIPADELVAIFVARPEPYKGLPETLEAMARIRAAGGRPPLLLVAGGRTGWIERHIERLALGDRTRLLGHRPDIPRCLRAADVFVLPTLYETFCQAAHEAAATKLPLIATPVHGIDELIGEDEAGLVVSRDPDSIAAAFVRLRGDAALRARLGAEGRRRCLARPRDGFPAATLVLYEELLSATRSVASSSRATSSGAEPAPRR